MRKNGKALSAMALILVLALGLCGCGKGGAIYEKGASIVALMHEMAGSEAYLELTANTSITSKLDAVREGDYSEPRAVYKLTVRDEAMKSMLSTELDGISDGLRSSMEFRACYALVSQVNAATGAETLAAASICSVSKSFADKSLKENVIYLYDYADAPAAAVVFSAGDEGTVYASGIFILNDEFKANSAESIEEYFHGMVEVVQAA